MPIVFENITFTGGILLSGASGTPAPLGDQYFQYTTLLLDGLGTNGKLNRTILDSSTNNFTITGAGNTTQGSFTPFSHTNGYWSNYFDGSGDYLTFGSNSALDFGTSSDFTFECWLNLTATVTSGQSNGIITNGNSKFSMELFFNTTSASSISINNYGFSSFGSSLGAIIPGNWYHIVLTRTGSTWRLFLNGILKIYVASNSLLATFSGATLGGGGIPSINGYITNCRISSGVVSQYSTSATTLDTQVFTSPTSPLTAISGTRLLTSQSNRFIDNSGNNNTITSVGNPSATLFQPFALSSEYNSSTMGGSIYFDGSGDFLSFSGLTIGTNAYTVEFWFYHTGTFSSAFAVFGASASNGLNININNSTTIAVDQQNVSQSTFTVPAMAPNTWNHVAVVRNSSNVTTVFLNGVRSTTGTVTMTNNYSGLSNYISRVNDIYYTGYLMDVRVSVGSAFYDPTQTTITVPTAPLTAISGTSLLLNGTNAGIVDSTGFNDLETVGNAQISTAQSKWGGSSMYFDGLSDFLKLLSTMPIYNKPLTIETWIYPLSRAYIMPVFVENTGGDGGEQLLKITTAGELMFEQRASAGYGPNIFLTTTSTLALNTWSHIALVLTTGGPRIYINGVLGASDNGVRYWANNAQNPTIGMNPYQGLVQTFNGYMQGFRITAGIVRYTGNFTPPTDY